MSGMKKGRERESEKKSWSREHIINRNWRKRFLDSRWQAITPVRLNFYSLSCSSQLWELPKAIGLGKEESWEWPPKCLHTAAQLSPTRFSGSSCVINLLSAVVKRAWFLMCIQPPLPTPLFSQRRLPIGFMNACTAALCKELGSE